MADKLNEYQGFVGQLHTLRDDVRGKWDAWKEHHPGGIKGLIKDTVENKNKRPPELDNDDYRFNSEQDYSHLYRRKTRGELVRISAAVMGIEFSYAAETAFVSPTLLKIGVEHQHMTLVWALSPLVGFFLTPILGSLSDRCRLPQGRRRPFIAVLAVGVFIGLILVPNGEDIGYSMGDRRPEYFNDTNKLLPHRTSAVKDAEQELNNSNNVTNTPVNSHPWGVFFTVLGTVLLDFDADACQSPSRAYLLDVTVPEDHAKGLSTFTIMAGLGGFMGYALGGINWDVTFIGDLFGGHVRAVFSLITIIFIICVTYTITSFKEIPLDILEHDPTLGQFESARKQSYIADHGEDETMIKEQDGDISYGTTDGKTNTLELQLKDNRSKSLAAPEGYRSIEGQIITRSGSDSSCYPSNDDTYQRQTEESPLNRSNDVRQTEQNIDELAVGETATLKQYLKSIVIMPTSLRMICLTNLFCWMAHVCYSLYFTDFVGEAVFGGNPAAPKGTSSHELYEAGVRFGCWGMSMYSLSCSCYSLIIEKLIKRFRARRVYVGGLLVYCTGMSLMALTKHRVGVILFSWTAGVMYSTLFTMPYLLIAHYHAMGVFEIGDDGQGKMGTQVRGLGTDVAIVSSMVFLAQFILSMCMGTIVTWSGTTTAVVAVASSLAFFGAISATQVMYLDL